MTKEKVCLASDNRTPVDPLVMKPLVEANIIGLKLSCRRHESIICTDIEHIHYQEKD